MKYMRQFGIILGVTCVGEIIKYFVHLPIPGSIYGLVLMLVLLTTKVIKIEQVKEVGEFLIEIMPLMFIPAAVGLMDSFTELKAVLLPVLVISVVSTLFVMIVTGKMAQGIIRRKQKGGESRE